MRRHERNVYLVGLRGTGKTTVGRLLAARLAVPFYDADEELEASAGRSIRDIFAADGEAGFRELEAANLASLSAVPRAVIATGGGIVLRESNRRLLRETGLIYWLTASVDEMCRRMLNDSTTVVRRPMLRGGGRAEVAQLLAERESLYRECADATIDTEGRSPSDVVEAILLSCSTFS